MPIRFYCTHCQAKIKVPGGSEGRWVKCPACARGQIVPDRSEAKEPGPREPDAAAPRDVKDVEPPSSGHDQSTTTIPDSTPQDSAFGSPQLVDTTETAEELAAVASDSAPQPQTPAHESWRDRPHPVPQPVPAKSESKATMPLLSPQSADQSTGVPSPRPTSEPPSYAALLGLCWAFRILAFICVGGGVKAVLLQLDEGLAVAGLARTLVKWFAMVAGAWLIAETAQAIRDIANNSFKRS